MFMHVDLKICTQDQRPSWDIPRTVQICTYM